MLLYSASSTNCLLLIVIFNYAEKEILKVVKDKKGKLSKRHFCDLLMVVAGYLDYRIGEETDFISSIEITKLLFHTSLSQDNTKFP